MRAMSRTNWMGWTLVVGLMMLGLVAGCSKSDAPTEKPAKPVPAATPGSTTTDDPEPIDPTTVAKVSGVVEVTGTLPDFEPPKVRGDSHCEKGHEASDAVDLPLVVNDGKLANAFVYIKSGLEAYEIPAPTGETVLDQRDCIFQPRVVGVQLGQPVTMLNSDPVLHNVHTKPDENKGKNIAMPNQGARRDFNFKKPEVMVPVVCDVHPWMRAFIGVVEHPFFAVTDMSGNFEINGVPPGTYTVEVWHELLGTAQAQVTVTASQDVVMSAIVFGAS